MNWEKKAVSPEQVKDISAKYGCDLLAASIFARRGITTGDSIQFFLEDDLRFLRNPFDLPGMEDAVERILAAKDEGERVLVFGDSDVDGITGTALLVEYLTGLGMDIRWRIPRGDDPYGLSMEAVEEFAADYSTLIITADCGISHFAEIRRAGELSVDVIVTDHHEPQEELPEALVILDPKLQDPAKDSPQKQPYPFKDLSGCGVAFKLVSALRFAQKSELYGQPMCLLNTRPANDSWVVEAAKMRNLVVTATLSETIMPGMISIGDTRLPAFLEGQQILVWDAPLQKRVLAKLFGTGVEIEMLDVSAEIGKEIPSVAGKSLVRIKELSTIAKYADREIGELDVFVSLFRSFAQKRERTGGAASVDEDYEMQLAALGTVGDIMPLLDENRIIVRNGLRSITPNGDSGRRVRPRPGIAELLDKLELSGSHFDVKDISWKVCPAINAGRRMGSPEIAAALLFEKDPVAREKLAGELVALNRQRKTLEEEIWSKAEPMAYRSLADHDEKIALAYGEDINKGVTGLIAQRIARRFNVPSIAVSFAPDVYTGSIRSARGYNIGSLLERFGDLFIDSGGHAFAGGFSLKKENWEAFTERLKTLAYSLEFDEAQDGQSISIDAELPLEYLNPDILKLVDRFAPYGKENEPLNFMAKKLVVEDINFIGKNESKHLRMTLAGGKHKWPALYWDAAVRVVNKEFGKGDLVDVVFTISRDWYKGIATPQMMISDLRKSE
ncbi:MAG: single-stranded-DNA-specific exonuclease RecJ [Treponema sp.]|jgi:single-stranded-DNA-specific exonuclease|nr:single-stranded-DNA-specific exonuclease RecJ [Treponema sp.]